MKGAEHIVAIVGMPGSGKSEVARLFRRKKFVLIRLGEETERGLREKGLSLTEENERVYREELRMKFGMAAYAVVALPKIHEALKKGKKVVLDGLYSWEEYLYLRDMFRNMTVVAIVASANVRYVRLEKRENRPLKKEEARQRDIDEINKLNKGGPIAIADHYIENSGTREELAKHTEALLKNLHE